MIDWLVKTRDLGFGVSNNGFGFNLQVFDLRVGNNSSFLFVCVRVSVWLCLHYLAFGMLTCPQLEQTNRPICKQKRKMPAGLATDYLHIKY